MEQKKLPIGYYLKLADDCLTKGIDKIQSRFGLNRVEWQVLHSIYGKPEISQVEVIELMEPMADDQLVKNIITHFLGNNYVEFKDEKVTMTAVGKDLHRSCLESQQGFRKKAVTGISEEDYQVTISTLQKMIANITIK